MKRFYARVKAAKGGTTFKQNKYSKIVTRSGMAIISEEDDEDMDEGEYY